MNSQDIQIKNSISDIKDALNKKQDKTNNEKELWKQIEILFKDLESINNNENQATKCLRKLIDSENFSINQTFQQLKESNEGLKHEHVYLKNKLKNTEMDLEKLKETVTRLMEKHDNQIQMLIASNAMHIDEIEATYSKQLVDANNKIRNMQNMNRELHITVNKFKQEQFQNNTNTNRPNNVLYFKPNKEQQEVNPRLSQERSFDALNNWKENLNSKFGDSRNLLNRISSPNYTEIKNELKENTATTYKVDCYNRISNNMEIQKSFTISEKKVLKSNKNHNIPPLKPLNESKTQKPKKKRKLFNPDDYEYTGQ